MPELNTVTDPNLPEPKGASTASEGEVYVADGEGSGAWQELWNRWSWNIANSNTTPVALTSGVSTVIANDASGAAYLDFGIPGTSDPWDAADNSFNFADAGLEVGDDFSIRIDLEYTVNSTNDGFSLDFHYADGESSEIIVPIAHENVDITGTQRFVISFTGFIGNSDVLNNPARMYIEADSTGDEILLNGFKFTALPRKHRVPE